MATNNDDPTYIPSSPIPFLSSPHSRRHRSPSGDSDSSETSSSPPSLPQTPITATARPILSNMAMPLSLPTPSSAAAAAVAGMHFGTGAGTGAGPTGSPTTDSPILAKLLGLPTGKGPASTFGRGRSPPNMGFTGFTEEPLEEEGTPLDEQQQHMGHHGRRASTSFTFPRPAPPSILDEQLKRGRVLLRRISLGSMFARSPLDSPPPHSQGHAPPPPTPCSPAPLSPASSGFLKPPPQNNGPGAGAGADSGAGAGSGRKERRATVHDPFRRAPSPMGERILKGHFDGFN